MEQSNLLINVINNISVSNTIFISIAIIALSVECTLLMNKGIMFLFELVTSKWGIYEGDKTTYIKIYNNINSSGGEITIGDFEPMEALRNFDENSSTDVDYIDRLEELSCKEFKKPIYKFKNKSLEKKKLLLFKELDVFRKHIYFLEDYDCNYTDFQLPQPCKHPKWSEEKKRDTFEKRKKFMKSKENLVKAYDVFVQACENKFNTKILNKH